MLIAYLQFGAWIGLLLGSAAADSTLANVLFVMLGMAVIAKGGDLFTDSAVGIARATRIPPAIIGATIVSLATTFPEFVVSVTGVMRGSAALSVGNALGSCCCNIGLIIGSCAVVSGLLSFFRGRPADGGSADHQMMAGPVLFMLAGGAALWALSVFNNPLVSSPFGLAAWEGVVLASILAAYLAYSTWSSLRARCESASHEQGSDAPEEARLGRREVIQFVVGAGLVLLGSRLLVLNAVQIARTFHVSELVIGLTILAIGTSLPEYTVALMSIFKGHSDLGIGNIVGANILNICGVVATCSLISPLPIERQTVMLDLPVALALMSLLALFAWKNKGRISAPAGAVLACIYGVYLLLL